MNRFLDAWVSCLQGRKWVRLRGVLRKFVRTLGELDAMITSHCHAVSHWLWKTCRHLTRQISLLSEGLKVVNYPDFWRTQLPGYPAYRGCLSSLLGTQGNVPIVFQNNFVFPVNTWNVPCRSVCIWTCFVQLSNCRPMHCLGHSECTQMCLLVNQDILVSQRKHLRKNPPDLAETSCHWWPKPRVAMDVGKQSTMLTLADFKKETEKLALGCVWTFRICVVDLFSSQWKEFVFEVNKSQIYLPSTSRTPFICSMWLTL